MTNLRQLEDFIYRVDHAERWDDIPEADWDEACAFASVDQIDCEDYGEVRDRLYSVWYSYTVLNDHTIEWQDA